MFTMNPVILAVSYAGSLALGIYMQGGSFIKKNIMITIPVVIFSVLIQPILITAELHRCFILTITWYVLRI